MNFGRGVGKPKHVQDNAMAKTDCETYFLTKHKGHVKDMESEY